MERLVISFFIFTSSIAFADRLEKVQSPVLENYTYYVLTSDTHKYGVNVDAKGGKYIFETCGTQFLEEGKHYTLSERQSYRHSSPNGNSAPAFYFRIYPGPSCQ